MASLHARKTHSRKYHPVTRSIKKLSKQYLSHPLRTMKKKPVEAISVLTLGLGLASGIIMFLKLRK